MSLSSLRALIIGSRAALSTWRIAGPVVAGLARILPDAWRERVVLAAERPIKRVAFDCRMCGNCVVSDTGLACPMTCPKSLRNGPCGGVREDGTCEVRPEAKCTWTEIWRGRGRLGVDGRALPAPDHRLAGRSTWVAAAPKCSLTPMPIPVPTLAEQVRVPLGRLETALAEGRLVATAEMPVFDGIDPAKLIDSARALSEVATALNVTDGAGANAHASSLAIAGVLANAGFTPVMQTTCRDRNRIALQADMVGAALLGIRNLVCLTGDSVLAGDHAQAKPVFDLDAVTLLEAAKSLTSGRYLSGRPLEAPLPLFLGAVENPFARPAEIRPGRLAAKVAAGARFVQTQYCFDVDVFADFMARVRDLGLHRRCAILVGVGPLVSAAAARRMCARVPGIHVSESVVARLDRASDPVREGVAICAETMARLAEIEGVAGFHLMSHRRPDLALAAVRQSGLAERLRPRNHTQDDEELAQMKRGIK